MVHLLTQPALPLRLGPAVEPPATSAMPAQTGVVNRTIVIRFQEGQARGGGGVGIGAFVIEFGIQFGIHIL